LASPPGLLIIIDEIELGLHEDAQKRFIKELKKVCSDRHVQIIATTHSPIVLKSVPPEARFFVDSHKDDTRFFNEVSHLYAAGMLASENSNELDVYVEDIISENIDISLLDNELRKRINVIPIGSSIAIIRQMAATFKHPRSGECLAIFDGDQTNKLNMLKNKFKNALETKKDLDIAALWFDKRVMFLPGETWPEKWLSEKLLEADTENLSKTFRVDDQSFKEFLEESICEGKHQEIHCLSNSLCVKDENLCYILTQWTVDVFKDEFAHILYSINSFLK
jgi:hypothetical protein